MYNQEHINFEWSLNIPTLGDVDETEIEDYYQNYLEKDLDNKKIVVSLYCGCEDTTCLS